MDCNCKLASLGHRLPIVELRMPERRWRLRAAFPIGSAPATLLVARSRRVLGEGRLLPEASGRYIDRPSLPLMTPSGHYRPSTPSSSTNSPGLSRFTDLVPQQSLGHQGATVGGPSAPSSNASSVCARSIGPTFASTASARSRLRTRPCAPTTRKAISCAASFSCS